MSTAKQREVHSVESYLAQFGQSDSRLEFVNGDVRATAAPTIRHNIIATNVLVALGVKLKGSKCRAFNSNSLVRIRHENSTWLYFPDASVVCESNSQSELFQDQPTLVVEVLSPSTRSIDRDEKVEHTFPSLPSRHTSLLSKTNRTRFSTSENRMAFYAKVLMELA